MTLHESGSPSNGHSMMLFGFCLSENNKPTRFSWRPNTTALRAWGMAEGHKTILMTKLTEMVHKEKLTPSQGGLALSEASFWGSDGGAGGWRSVR